MPHWHPLTVRLSAEERAALAELLARNQTPAAGEIRHALREYLRREGFWPPAPPNEKAPPA